MILVYLHKVIVEKQIDWVGVPLELQAKWQDVFQESEECLNLSASCPVCGVAALHRWYQIGKLEDIIIRGKKFMATRSGLWEWCSSCNSFEHYSCAVPSWWSCDLEVDIKKLTALPTAIEDARKSQEKIHLPD